MNRPSKPWYRELYVQVLIAVLIGIGVGYLFPDSGRAMKPLGDGFIKLVKMMIAPVIFCTVVQGIATLGDNRQLGRVGTKALIYFELVSTVALAIGLLVVNVLKPGAGFTPAGETFNAAHVALATTQGYIEQAHALKPVDQILNLIPTTFFSAFVSGDLLQVLLVAILAGFAIRLLGERRTPVLVAVNAASEVFFKAMQLVVQAAPVGAFGAMAFTVGNFGLGALNKLALLMGGFYLTAALFVVVVLGGIARVAGFSIFRYLRYIRDELLLVLGTSSSETALPGMLDKLQRLGCKKSTVGLVLPLGYSFNLDGTNIYMTMAAVFLAQATNTPLDLSQQLSLLLVAMLTSKGASGVTGAGFVTLAATLQAVPGIPLEALALLIGIDRFMSECRALTNLIGNGVATLVLSRWEREVSAEELNANLRVFL